MMIKKSYNDFDTFMQDIIDVYLENEGFSVLCDYKLACKIIKKFLSFDNKTKIIPFLLIRLSGTDMVANLLFQLLKTSCFVKEQDVTISQ